MKEKSSWKEMLPKRVDWAPAERWSVWKFTTKQPTSEDRISYIEGTSGEGCQTIRISSKNPWVCCVNLKYVQSSEGIIIHSNTCQVRIFPAHCLLSSSLTLSALAGPTIAVEELQKNQITREGKRDSATCIPFLLVQDQVRTQEILESRQLKFY